MIQVRKKADLFYIDGEWFQGYWHFSFDQYHDPLNMNFGALRVFNVDTLVPGGVWPMHPHRDNEVVTYCAGGVFQHGDNLGNSGLLHVGDVQHTTVGRGMWHTEVNASQTEPMTFVQMWFVPEVRGLPPSVEVKHVEPEERVNRLLPLVSNRHEGALPIRQDAEVYSSTLKQGHTVEHHMLTGQGAYLCLLSGALEANGQALAAGDATKVTDETSLSLKAVEEAHLLLVVVQV
ncbi:MAG: pirin family protein [Chloroflexi bacterium]|nr:pirin family protein [Chloroflexota bacterium]